MKRLLFAVIAVSICLAGCGGSSKHHVSAVHCPNGLFARPCGPHIKGWAQLPQPQNLTPRLFAPIPTREGYDSIVVSTVPANPWAVAGYVDGSWPDFGAISHAFPAAHHLSIAPFAGDSADCLDVEPRDATPSEAPGWAHRMINAGHKLVCLYTSISGIPQLKGLVASSGIPLNRIKWWCAWYRYFPGLVSGCDAVQWTDHAFGRNLDGDTFRTDFFGPPPPPPGPSQATITGWRKNRETAFGIYRGHGCKNPQTGNQTPASFGTPNVCRDQGAAVISWQGKLWTVFKRWACFGPGAQTTSEVCWVVRPEVSYWSSARKATFRAYAAHQCRWVIYRAHPGRRPVCVGLSNRWRYFNEKASQTVKAFS